jgi:hypothetical protein
MSMTRTTTEHHVPSGCTVGQKTGFTCAIECCHGEHGFLIGLFHFLLADNKLDLVPSFRLGRRDV